MALYTFTPNEDMSLDQMKKILIFLVKYVLKAEKVDDKVVEIPETIKQHFTKQ